MAIPTVSRYVYLLWLYLLWLHSLWLLPLPWRCAHPGTVAPPTYYGRVLTPCKMRSLLREAIEAQGSEHNWQRITDMNPNPKTLTLTPTHTPTLTPTLTLTPNQAAHHGPDRYVRVHGHDGQDVRRASPQPSP